MTNRIAIRRKTLSVIAVVLGLLLVAAFLVFGNPLRSEASLSPLPSMTLVYEVYGPAISVGDRSVEPFRETHRLDYRSKTDWTDTVIESPSVDLGRYGSGSNVGSYKILNGALVTEYEAMSGSARESTVSDNSVFVPNSAFAFALGTSDPIGDTPGITKSLVVTDARVCFNGECQENAVGRQYTDGRMNVVFLEGDSWVIPLKLGDGFLVKSAEIQAPAPSK